MRPAGRIGKFTATIHGNWLGGLPNYDGTSA